MEAQPKEKKTADKKKYIREYMKKRYENDTNGERAYSRSIKFKNKNNIDDEEFKKYGKYLADVYKLRDIFNRIPNELFYSVCGLEKSQTN
jgi:hypothetical protein